MSELSLVDLERRVAALEDLAARQANPLPITPQAGCSVDERLQQLLEEAVELARFAMQLPAGITQETALQQETPTSAEASPSQPL